MSKHTYKQNAPQISTFRLISLHKITCLLISNSKTVQQQHRVYQKLGDKIIGHELKLGSLTKHQN